MEVVVLESELPIICRTCLSENKELYVLKDRIILELFHHIVKVEIDQEDQLPQGVCSVCLVFLEKVNEFIITCRTSDEILRSALMLKYAAEGGHSNNPLVETESIVILDCSEEDTNNEVATQQISQEPVESDQEIKLAPIVPLDSSYAKTNHEEYVEQISSKTDILQKENETQNGFSSDCSNTGTRNVSSNFARTLKKIKNEIEKRKQNKIKKENIPKKERCLTPMFECHWCNMKCFNLKQHYSENPSCSANKSNCNICSKKFSRRCRLKKHLRSHTKENPFQCKKCPKKFRYPENLRRHQSLHDGLHLCPVCNKGFTQKFLRNEHFRIHTGETPYVCDYCGKRFRQYYNHRTHILRHKVANGELPNEEGKYDCDECGRGFSSNNALNRHKLAHKGEKNFLCSECGKSFVTKGSLSLHIRLHSGVKPFKCPHCDKSFALKTGLQYHVLIHLGIRPFTCNVCNRSFTQRPHLTSHMRTHTGEKPYVCSYCGRAFALNGNLRVHERTHTGETPYVCPTCNVGFYDSTSLKKHQKVHLKLLD